MSMTTVAGMAERAAWYGALAEVLAETAGEGARRGDPVHSVTLAAWSAQQAWHAELWAARVPDLPASATEASIDDLLTRAATRLEPVRATLQDNDPPRLVELIGRSLFPQLGALLVDDRAAIDWRLDGPTARVLDLVLADVERATATAARLEAGTATEHAATPIDLRSTR